MADRMTRAQRSYTMSRIRSAGNESTEKRLARLLRKAGITGWRRHRVLPGRPDFVFPEVRVVVFVDGCFWHGCQKCHSGAKSNRSYWGPKIAGNATRDKRTDRALRARGWTVVRIWEHSLEKRPGHVLDRVLRATRPVGVMRVQDRRRNKKWLT